MPEAALVWFRNDLRLSDNPALSAALQSGRRVAAVFVHETDKGLRPRGAASRWWLHHSLNALAADLAGLGIPLEVVEGTARAAVIETAERYGADDVYLNWRYAPSAREVDAATRRTLEQAGVTVHEFNGALLLQPWGITTDSGKPYSAFTPFFAALRERDIARPLPAPASAAPPLPPKRIDTRYGRPPWTAKLEPLWRVGEAAAQQALDRFLTHGLADYPEARDQPGKAGTSRLSPHLAFGEISPRQIWHASMALVQRNALLAQAAEKFLSELAWREFNYAQLYHRQDIAQFPMVARHAVASPREAPEELQAWQRGRTGIPIVDAGMRELWATGFMENRVRMLAASLLAKNLLIDWRVGERWFWDCLVDADPANNPGNWQWVAGCGLDASPFTRIFNPVLQGEKFDADGDYVRQWVPELSGLPARVIHKPWLARPAELEGAGVVLGKTYPHPIVELKTSRQRALDAVRGG